MAKKKRTPQQAWQDALVLVGGITEMARLLNTSHQRLARWSICKGEFAIPVARAIRQVADARPSTVTIYDLRPDLYPQK